MFPEYPDFTFTSIVYSIFPPGAISTVVFKSVSIPPDIPVVVPVPVATPDIDISSKYVVFIKSFTIALFAYPSPVLFITILNFTLSPGVKLLVKDVLLTFRFGNFGPVVAVADSVSAVALFVIAP